jgi:hypothetical protein
MANSVTRIRCGGLEGGPGRRVQFPRRHHRFCSPCDGRRSPCSCEGGGAGGHEQPETLENPPHHPHPSSTLPHSLLEIKNNSSFLQLRQAPSRLARARRRVGAGTHLKSSSSSWVRLTRDKAMATEPAASRPLSLPGAGDGAGFVRPSCTPTFRVKCFEFILKKRKIKETTANMMMG